MDLDDDELLATQISRRYIKKDIVKRDYISKYIIRDKIKELEEEERKNKFTEKDKKRLAKIEVLVEVLKE